MMQHAIDTKRLHTPMLYSTTRMNRVFENYSEEDPEARHETEKENTANCRASPPLNRGVGRLNQSANLPRKHGTNITSPGSATDEATDEGRGFVLDAFIEGGRYLLMALKVVGYLSRWPIAFCLTGLLLMSVMDYFSPSFRRSFQPLCGISGMPLRSVCRMTLTTSAGDFNPRWTDYSRLIDNQNKSLEQLLAHTAPEPVLALKIKLMGIATEEWIIQVRVSDLKEKGTLANNLMEFVMDVTIARSSLHELASNIRESVDRIREVNDDALQSIVHALANKPSIISWTSAKNDEAVNRTFAEAMNVLSANMLRLLRLVAETQSNCYILHDRLIHLHRFLARNISLISKDRFNLLQHLWTKLGGNRKSLRSFERQLVVVMELEEYSQHALVHVVDVLQTLRAIRTDLEDMYNRIEAPEPMGPTRSND
ncbi:hypothetical protein BDN70DRAFT_567160 [Pholiota conissans]|uniref:Uncharacterized protein n=1 Tax=Pholiota conissans TaxID=109636 RepID=A0A9P6CM99_9AGAR|nr:hypothetical protein BDN70DRAFT_567160 [Pholiota conissans]